MIDPALHEAVVWLAPGRYAVGVSGGADSVALLHLLHHHRRELALHVVHLDHQIRGKESEGDAVFVEELARSWRLPCTIARRSEIEPDLEEREGNPSARYRACRLELFRRVVEKEKLDGVLLAHHAGDQAETIFQRLLRGSAASGLAGMAREAHLGKLRILRPLLGVPGVVLRKYLASVKQSWREDASNVTDKYFRNRLRRVLGQLGDLGESLLRLGGACAELKKWVRSTAPQLAEEFPVAMLRNVPDILAAESARRWLVARGVRPAEAGGDVAARLVAMATDAASAPRQHFPGGILVRRRGGKIGVAG